jgi:hypothetical protein
MTPGEAYCAGLLVRVVGPNFTAGLIFDRKTDRVIAAAPILRHLIGAHADKLREGFKRLGWRATIVR